MKSPKTLIILIGLIALPVSAGFEVKEDQGRIEIIDNGKVVFGWQSTPIKNP
ncbi:MAG: hypothetical protein HKP15_10145, partial [Akkermansiaceae bacterium]|nr:hypothetical protein [Akkermansiaceae bacterium]